MTEFERLIEAAKRGDLADVRGILQSHANFINQWDRLGATAIHHAAFWWTSLGRSGVGKTRRGNQRHRRSIRRNSYRVGNRIPSRNGWIPGD
jgi:hypothetical protein